MLLEVCTMLMVGGLHNKGTRRNLGDIQFKHPVEDVALDIQLGMLTFVKGG